MALVGTNDQIFVKNFADNNDAVQITNVVGVIAGLAADAVTQTLFFGLGSGTQFDIWKIKLDGTGLTNLTNSPAFANRFPALHPISGLLYFTRGLDISLMDQNGGGLTQVSFSGLGDQRPAISDDGNSLAFVRNVGGNIDVWHSTITGLNQVRYTTSADFDGEPVFVGNKLAWTTRIAGQLDVVWADFPSGANQQNLTDTPSNESGARPACGTNGMTTLNDRLGLFGVYQLDPTKPKPNLTNYGSPGPRQQPLSARIGMKLCF